MMSEPLLPCSQVRRPYYYYHPISPHVCTLHSFIPPASGFLVLHAEPEQKPQVDLEQLIAGEHAPKSRTHGPLLHPNLPISVWGFADPVGTRRD